MQEDAIVERYNTVTVFSLFPVMFLVSFSYKYYSGMIDEFIDWSVAVSVAMALATFVVVGLASKRTHGRFPWGRKYLATLLYSLVLFPLLGTALVLGTNCYFDESDPIVRNTVIVGKNESHRHRKGRKRDYYWVYVQSWRSDRDRIGIQVGGDDFKEFEVGDTITLRTKSGLWGLEHLCENR